MSRTPQPPGLVVERIACEGEELVLFSWDQPRVDTTVFSPSERAVLAAVARGERNLDIARARSTSSRTVANQIAGLLRKTGCASRFDLIRRFAELARDA